jgi:hypothetical protein
MDRARKCINDESFPSCIEFRFRNSSSDFHVLIAYSFTAKVGTDLQSTESSREAVISVCDTTNCAEMGRRRHQSNAKCVFHKKFRSHLQQSSQTCQIEPKNFFYISRAFQVESEEKGRAKWIRYRFLRRFRTLTDYKRFFSSRIFNFKIND